MRVAFAAAIVIDDDFQEIGFFGQLVIAAGRAENGIERIDVLDMETDPQVLSDGFRRGINLSEHLVFAFVKQTVPENDLRVLDEQPPEFDEITVGGPMAGEGILDELVELEITLA